MTLLRFLFAAFLLALMISSSDDSDDEESISKTVFTAAFLDAVVLLLGFLAIFADNLRPVRLVLVDEFLFFLAMLLCVLLSLGEIHPSSSVTARAAFGVILPMALARACLIGNATVK